MDTAHSRSGLLFICIANSIRSQIAEGVARHIAPEGVEVYSAGVSPGRLSAHVVRVLSESGIDASEQYSKPLSAVPYGRIATVITLCPEDLRNSLPAGPEVLRWPIEDPTASARSEDEFLDSLRRLRDELEGRLKSYFAQRRSGG